MIGEDRMVHFSGCALNEACTIVLRGASECLGRGHGGRRWRRARTRMRLPAAAAKFGALSIVAAGALA